MNKAYIITNPCSGKSTFINSHKKRYKNLHLIDHDYTLHNHETLKGLSEYSCILGQNHIPKFDECIYAIVLIDKELLNLYSPKREIEAPDNLRVGELLFSHPEEGYYKVQQTAKEYNIPVFKTFKKALDFVITEIISSYE